MRDIEDHETNTSSDRALYPIETEALVEALAKTLAFPNSKKQADYAEVRLVWVSNGGGLQPPTNYVERIGERLSYSACNRSICHSLHRVRLVFLCVFNHKKQTLILSINSHVLLRKRHLLTSMKQLQTLVGKISATSVR